MHSLADTLLQIPFHWWIVVTSCAVGLAAICSRVFETEESRARRTERNKKKELRSLAEKISGYGRSVHQRYPTGDVVVSELDLAEQLRKRPEVVQRAPLSGYWKLNA
jgi:hypothetical protein